ncbi:MAG: hypothetical protein DRR06_14060 [Gammaproteobacteria bacterium]|nr:MAG: hypothetical protein DRR06_14060 [Gammaproteobacteria bacterium]
MVVPIISCPILRYLLAIESLRAVHFTSMETNRKFMCRFSIVDVIDRLIKVHWHYYAVASFLAAVIFGALQPGCCGPVGYDNSGDSTAPAYRWSD